MRVLLMTTLAAMLMATASVAQVSTITFTLTADTAGISPWNFTAGIRADANDTFDSLLDAVEPPWAPAPEIRLHTLNVPGASGGLMMDKRDGASYIDISSYWTPVAGTEMRLETWGLNAVDMAYPDLCAIDGNALGTSGTTTGVMTWDLSAVGIMDYYVYVVDTDTEFKCVSGGSYAFSVDNRGGIGPTLVVSCRPIPEPGTLLLLGSALIGVAGITRRR